MSPLLLLALLLVGVVLGVAWGLGRLPNPPVTDREYEFHLDAMREDDERKAA